MEALEALVLAAGAGSRFGGGKLLAPWRDGLLLHGALAAAFAAPTRTVTLVWGADPRVAEAAQAWATAHGEQSRLRLVEAKAHAQGLSASLQAGLASLPADCGGAFVFLGDMPRVSAEILQPLAQALATGAAAAAPVFEGRRGHPVLLGSGLFRAVAALEGDRGAGPLLSELGPALATVQAADDGVLYDIDRPQDLSE
ncbi:nucleotidyltransferase family protein [Phenylobacterium montanum]|uniref:Nucleotidyltransferase family protein n=1 Tax=Phenylobacterium montanum TaxID=2823693 RepID=A0A975G4X2_9CAUL|nr:nucleotidyltransferase family protein [Caulobacter sp. S6]